MENNEHGINKEEGMTHIAESKVLVSGFGGLGVEVAKNVILSGAKSVTVQDTIATSWDDLSSQFYLRKADIGKNRATQCLKYLTELNPDVTVFTSVEPLTSKLVAEGKYNTVVVTDGNSETITTISQWCHENNVKFILAQVKGVFSRIFCDFGEEFIVVDGENPLSTLITGITKEEMGAVYCLDETRHRLSDGDFIIITQVIGMTELNEHEPIQIEVTGPYSFKLKCDTRGFTDYIRGGVATQVKMPENLSFKSFAESIKYPESIISDYSKMEDTETKNIAFQALESYVDQHGSVPRGWNEDDAQVFLKIATEIAEPLDIQLNEKLTRIFSYVCSGQVCPMNSFVGGVVAQEVMKSVTGKFRPLVQWMFFDAIECLPFELNDNGSLKTAVDESEFQGIGSRYDGQIPVFGKKFLEVIGNQKWLLVGAGEFGCELLKNLAMIGLGGGGKGKIIVTDMEVVGRPSTSQFLFRLDDVGFFKSSCAAIVTQSMNPDINIESHVYKMGVGTEDTYNDAFYDNIDGVVTTLDNIDVRMYMHRRCLMLNKFHFFCSEKRSYYFPEEDNLGPVIYRSPSVVSGLVTLKILEKFGVKQEPLQDQEQQDHEQQQPLQEHHDQIQELPQQVQQQQQSQKITVVVKGCFIKRQDERQERIRNLVAFRGPRDRILVVGRDKRSMGHLAARSKDQESVYWDEGGRQIVTFNRNLGTAVLFVTADDVRFVDLANTTHVYSYDIFRDFILEQCAGEETKIIF